MHHSSSFMNCSLSCHIRCYIVCILFPPSLLLCEIESQLPDSTVQRSILLAQSVRPRKAPFVRPLKQQAQPRIPQSRSTLKQSSTGLEAGPTALNQPARGKVSLRENAGQQQPGPCDDREKATGGSAGRRLVYAAH